MLENILQDLYAIYRIVQESETEDRDIEDILMDIECYIQKYKELTVEETQKHDNELN